ncbi:MAG: transferrin-binding protein-like solute binding protein [Paracoccaceae bacterium]
MRIELFKTPYLSIVPLAAILGISGCGAPGDSTPGNGPPPSSYETLDSTAAVTSTLGGTGLKGNLSNLDVELVSLTGTLAHDTGAMAVTDGTYSLSGIVDASGNLTDGNAEIKFGSVPGTYSYTQTYVLLYESGGGEYAVVGVDGIITHPAHVPSTGSGTYIGGAVGSINSGTTIIDLTNGTSTVGVDFGAGTVDVTLTGFTPVHDSGPVIPVPIDTISVTGMNISGNSFSGGTLSTLNGGTTVDITGANRVDLAEGRFFGYDTATLQPVEVGGVIMTAGDSGAVVGVFIAVD